MLHAHICVFAVSIVVMFLVNLLRDPGHIWADRWIMAWTVLVLIHAVAVGIVWGIRLWNADAPDEPLQMSNSGGWRQSPMFAWGSTSEGNPDAQDVDYRVASTGPTPPVDPAPPAEGTPGWTGWNAEPETPTPPASERASWKEASAAAWLNRGDKTPAPPATETKPDS